MRTPMKTAMQSAIPTAIRAVTRALGLKVMRGSRAGCGARSGLARAARSRVAPRHTMRARVCEGTWCGLAICATFATWATLALGAVPAARAQGSRKDDVVFNAQGRPMAGASVRVCTAAATGQPCAPLANIYSDAALTQALANPTTTDGLGNYSFYAAPGRYMIEISGPGITTKQLPNVILPNDPSVPTFTSLTTTSGINAFSLSLSGNLTVTGSTAVTGALTVGGAAVPSTGQANTWSAQQTFSQDVISGSKVPWTDVRAAGAVCNNSNDDSTALNATISGMVTSGGTPLFPDNCRGALSFSAPSNNMNLMFGGRFNPTATMHVPVGYFLGCHEPYVHTGSGTPFINVETCPVIANLDPVLSLENTSGWRGTISNLSFYGTGVQIAENKSANTVIRDVWSQAASDSATPFQGTDGFGYYFERGGFESSSPTGQPSMNFLTSASVCDPPRMITLDRTFIVFRGIHFSSACGAGGFNFALHSTMQLYENASECMFCLDVTNNGYGAIDLYEPIISDNIAPAPLISIIGSRANGLKSSVIINGGGEFFRQQPGGNAIDGAIVLGETASYNPLGIMGLNNNWFMVNKHGSLTTFANSPSIAAGGGLKVPPLPPLFNATPSASGGTLASGTYCYTVVPVDSLANEGQPSADACPVVTGPTGSVSIALGGFVPAGAATYHIYRTTGMPVEDDYQTNKTVWFTSTLASAFVDTGAAGTAGLPAQMDPNPWSIAATDELNPNGSGWLGVGGCVAIGKQGCSGGVAGDLQAAGKISAANWPLAASATLTYTAIAAQTCQEQNVTVAGAASTGVATASPAASLGNVNLSWSAWVSAANTVSVRVCNPSAGSITPSAVAWQARVIQ